jgi:hypothetical protein
VTAGPRPRPPATYVSRKYNITANSPSEWDIMHGMTNFGWRRLCLPQPGDRGLVLGFSLLGFLRVRHRLGSNSSSSRARSSPVSRRLPHHNSPSRRLTTTSQCCPFDFFYFFTLNGAIYSGTSGRQHPKQLVLMGSFRHQQKPAWLVICHLLGRYYTSLAHPIFDVGPGDTPSTRLQDRRLSGEI